MPPNLFSKEDQTYIKDWITANQMLSEKNLHISLKKHRLKDYEEKDKEHSTKAKGTDVCFEVTFSNLADMQIEDLYIEYEYFITEVGCGERADSARKVSGKASINRIEERKSKKITTIPEGIADTYVKKLRAIQSQYGGTETETVYVKIKEDRLEGIWLRVYGPSVKGVRSYRDISYPPDLKDKQEWDDIKKR